MWKTFLLLEDQRKVNYKKTKLIWKTLKKTYEKLLLFLSNNGKIRYFYFFKKFKRDFKVFNIVFLMFKCSKILICLCVKVKILINAC